MPAKEKPRKSSRRSAKANSKSSDDKDDNNGHHWKFKDMQEEDDFLLNDANCKTRKQYTKEFSLDELRAKVGPDMTQRFKTAKKYHTKKAYVDHIIEGKISKHFEEYIKKDGGASKHVVGRKRGKKRVLSNLSGDDGDDDDEEEQEIGDNDDDDSRSPPSVAPRKTQKSSKRRKKEHTHVHVHPSSNENANLSGMASMDFTGFDFAKFMTTMMVQQQQNALPSNEQQQMESNASNAMSNEQRVSKKSSSMSEKRTEDTAQPSYSDCALEFELSAKYFDFIFEECAVRKQTLSSLTQAIGIRTAGSKWVLAKNGKKPRALLLPKLRDLDDFGIGDLDPIEDDKKDKEHSDENGVDEDDSEKDNKKKKKRGGNTYKRFHFSLKNLVEWWNSSSVETHKRFKAFASKNKIKVPLKNCAIQQKCKKEWVKIVSQW